MTNGKPPKENAKGLTLLVVLIVVAVLYFAQTIFIPLAFSILLAFMLAPLVVRLRRLRLGRVPSAAIVVLVAFVILGIFGAVLASQLADLAHKLPEYQHNVHQKVESIRASGGGFVKRLSGAAQQFSDELTPPPSTGTNQPPEERPVPVEIRRSAVSPVDLIQKVLGSVVGVLVTAGLVIVFVIFMLIQQDDLRDRLIRLAGSSQVSLTTNVLDDAAHRVSRYLLAQLVVNTSYGLATGTVLYFIHVPDPLLWGLLAVVLRYIPYLGIWIAAAMPAAVALAVKPGWIDIPIVFGTYIGIDLLMYNFAEPLLYGSSTGLSPLAVLVAAVFWTWLWGPAGLLLATPLTVCVVVIGHHVSNLAFLQVLLSDQPVLPPQTRFYQRLLAMDFDGAKLVLEQFLTGKSLPELFDTVVVPALKLAEVDRHRGKLDTSKEEFIFQNVRVLVEQLAAAVEQAAAPGATSLKGAEISSPAPSKLIIEPVGTVEVLCLPARDEADELAALMLKLLLKRRGIGAKLMKSGTSVAAVSEEVARAKPKVACVTGIPPFAFMHTRYLCRRMHARFKELKLVAALFSDDEPARSRRTPGPPSADEVAVTLSQAVDKITHGVWEHSEKEIGSAATR